MAKLNRFQTQKFQGWKGLTKDNHLASIYQRAPQQVADYMVQLLALNRGKSLESELAKYPTKEFDTDDEFTWQVIGSSSRYIPLIEARYENGSKVRPYELTLREDECSADFWALLEEDFGNKTRGQRENVGRRQAIKERKVEQIKQDLKIGRHNIVNPYRKKAQGADESITTTKN